MVINRFNHLKKIVESIVDDKVLRNAIKKGTSKEATAFYDEIVDMLRFRRYPLRRGEIANGAGDRVDPIRGLTPTQRLHPGSPPLHQGMRKPRFSTTKEGVRILMTNVSDHAALFFEEIEPHPIPTSGENEPPLYFWWGAPLPWDRLDGGKPGPVKTGSINHPGHMAYLEIVDELYREKRERPLTKALWDTISNLIKVKFQNA
jgi:hypothetical protein